MEESRASAGGIMFNTGAMQSAAPANNQQSNESVSDEILKYKKMMDDGIISDTEFAELKAKLLSKGNNF